MGRLPEMPALMAEVLPLLDGHGARIDLLSRARVPSPPTETAQGGYIADGYDAALDDLRRMAGDGRRAIAALEAKYRTQTGITALKIRHNAVLGYHVEVPSRHGEALAGEGSGFTHRQPPAGAGGSNSADLREEETRVGQAEIG